MRSLATGNSGTMLIAFEGVAPQIHPTAWIAPGCMIIGDVQIGASASIWYNCVLRGDVNAIRIGAGTNVQDGTVIHCDSGGNAGPGYPTLIGENALIGHSAVVHGATLHDESFVGIGAIAMDGSVIEAGGMLAAGAMLTPRKAIGAREIWSGRPASMLRSLREEEVARNRESVVHYRELSIRHRAAIEALVSARGAVSG
jgi:carbonic anhydrase/acetyltransferase-like protein (isoleucine patch superfamily)